MPDQKITITIDGVAKSAIASIDAIQRSLAGFQKSIDETSTSLGRYSKAATAAANASVILQNQIKSQTAVAAQFAKAAEGGAKSTGNLNEALRKQGETLTAQSRSMDRAIKSSGDLMNTAKGQVAGLSNQIRAATNATNAFERLGTALKGQTEQISAATRLRSALTGAINGNTKATREHTDETKSATVASGAMNESVRQKSMAFRDAANSSRDLTAELTQMGIAAGALAAAILIPTKNAIGLTAAYEENQVSLASMLGSMEIANKTLEELQAFAVKTPFNFNELVGYSKQLVAYGVQAQDLIPVFTMLGNAAAGVGKEKLGSLVLAFGQVQARARLTGIELRNIATTGIPLLEQLGKNLGVAKEDVRGLVHEGKVSAADFEKAIFDLTTGTGKFADMMEKQSLTIGGFWTNIVEKVQLSGIKMFQPWIPEIKSMERALLSLVTTFMNMDPVLLKFFGLIAVGGAGFLAVGSAILLVSAAVMKLGTAFAFLNLTVAETLKKLALLAIHPVVLPLTLIAVAIAGISFALKKMGSDWEYTFDRIAISFGVIFRNLKALVTLATEGKDAYVEAIENIDKIKKKEIAASKRNLADRTKSEKQAANEIANTQKNLAQAMAAFGAALNAKIAAGNKKHKKTKSELRDEEREEIFDFELWQYQLFQTNLNARLALAESERSAVLAIGNRFKTQFETQNQALMDTISDQWGILYGNIARKSLLANSKIEKSMKHTSMVVIDISKKGAEEYRSNMAKAINEAAENLRVSFTSAQKLGLEFVRDFQGTLSKTIDSYLNDPETGFITQIGNSLKSYAKVRSGQKGGLGGEVLGFITGGMGGLISMGIGAVVQGIFGGAGKTVAEYAEEAFSRLVATTNKKLSELGRQRTVTEKQIKFLETLAEGRKGGLASVLTAEERKKYTGVAGPEISIQDLINELRQTRMSQLEQENQVQLRAHQTATQLKEIADVARERIRIIGNPNATEAERAMNWNKFQKLADAIIKNPDIDERTRELFRIYSHEGSFDQQLFKEYEGLLESIDRGYQESLDKQAQYSSGYYDRAIELQESQNEYVKKNADAQTEAAAAAAAEQMRPIDDLGRAIQTLDEQMNAFEGIARAQSAAGTAATATTESQNLVLGSQRFEAGASYQKIIDSLKLDKFSALKQREQSGLLTADEVLKSISERAHILAELKESGIFTGASLPELAKGTDGSSLEPYVARFSPGEIVIPKNFSNLITSGKMTLSAPTAPNQAPMTINISGTAKSAEQLFNEMKPSLQAFLAGNFSRSPRGEARPRF